MRVVIVQRRSRSVSSTKPGPSATLLDLVGRAGMRIGEGDVEHRADRWPACAPRTSTFLMCGTRSCAIETSTAGLSSMRLTGPSLGLLDLDGFVEMRLQRLPHEAVEPHDAGAAVGIERRIEPRQDAAAAVGRDAHDARRRRRRASPSARASSRIASRALLPSLVREMIDAGMDMRRGRRGRGRRAECVRSSIVVLAPVFRRVFELLEAAAAVDEGAFDPVRLGGDEFHRDVRDRC